MPRILEFPNSQFSISFPALIFATYCLLIRFSTDDDPPTCLILYRFFQTPPFLGRPYVWPLL